MTIKLYFDELSLLTYIILFIEMTFKVAIMIKMALKISVTMMHKVYDSSLFQ